MAPTRNSTRVHAKAKATAALAALAALASANGAAAYVLPTANDGLILRAPGHLALAMTGGGGGGDGAMIVTSRAGVGIGGLGGSNNNRRFLREKAPEQPQPQQTADTANNNNNEKDAAAKATADAVLDGTAPGRALKDFDFDDIADMDGWRAGGIRIGGDGGIGIRGIGSGWRGFDGDDDDKRRRLMEHDDNDDDDNDNDRDDRDDNDNDRDDNDRDDNDDDNDRDDRRKSRRRSLMSVGAYAGPMGARAWNGPMRPMHPYYLGAAVPPYYRRGYPGYRRYGGGRMYVGY